MRWQRQSKLLSITHRFLFIHVPKTAGNSIQLALNQYADEKISVLKPWQDGVENFEIVSEQYGLSKHSTLSEYKKKLGKDIYSGLFKFTVVRNPWERAISNYFYLKKYGARPTGGIPEQSDPAAFDKNEFIRSLAKLSPLTKWVCTDNKIVRKISAFFFRDKRGNRLEHTDIDYFILFENLQNDFDSVCNKIGISPEKLGIRNKIDHLPYAKYYDEEMYNLVHKKYRDEIEYFNYTFENR